MMDSLQRTPRVNQCQAMMHGSSVNRTPTSFSWVSEVIFTGLAERTFVVATTIEDAKDCDHTPCVVNFERDDGAPPIVRDAKPGSNIVAFGTPVRESRKALAVGHDRFGIPRRNYGRAVLGDVLIERNQAVLGLRREDDGVGLHAFAARLLCIAASRVRTLDAGTAREGDVLSAS
jgi:hypothetical protein